VSWIVTGANDAPVVSGAATGSATEDGATVTLDALANASDADTGTTLSVINLPQNLPAGVTYDADTHSFTLDPSNAAYQYLAQGQQTTVTVNYSVSDGITSTPASVSWTVTGANDAPVIETSTGGITITEVAVPNMYSLLGGMSADGNLIVFTASANVPGTGIEEHSGAVYLYDRASDTLTNISDLVRNPHPGEGFGNSFASISADGRYVVFQGHYTDNDHAASDIYLYDRNTGTVTDIVQPAGVPQISGDGQVVVMESTPELLITDRNGTVLHTINAAEVNSSLSTGYTAVWLPATNYDGHYIVFWATAGSQPDNLDDDAMFGLGGSGDLILYDRLSGTFQQIGSTQSDAGNWQLSMSNDGRFVVYQSFDQYGQSNIYLYDATTHQTTLVSAGFDGSSILGSISGDGHYIIFASGELSQGNDPFSQFETYLYDRLTGTISLLSTGPNGTGGNDGSGFGTALSADGSVAAFGSLATDLMSNGVAGGVYIVTHGGTDGSDGSVTEDQHSSTETTFGTVAFSDVDLTDIHNVTGVTASPGALGTLTAEVTTDTTGSGTGGVITWTYSVDDSLIQYLGQGDTRTESFTISLFDGTATVTHDVVITIYGTNDAPTLDAVTGPTYSDSVQFDHFAAVTGTLSGHDVDSATLIFGIDRGQGDDSRQGYDISRAGNYGVLYVNSATGAYIYVPDDDAINALTTTATDDFTFTLSDGNLSARQAFTVTVNGANDAPVANADTGSAGENEIKSFDVLANDTDADAGDSKSLVSLESVTVTSANGAIDGIDASSAFSIADGQVQFNPGTLFDALAAGQTATVVVQYTMQDSAGAQSSSTLTLTVTGANDAPIANNDSYSTYRNHWIIVTAASGLLANDTDADTPQQNLTVALVSGPSHGTLFLNADGSFVYVPTGNYTGTDTFTYRTWDGSAWSNVATATVAVSGANRPPVILAPGEIDYWTRTSSGDVAVIDQIKFADTDAGNDPVFVTLSLGSSNGSLDAAIHFGDGVVVFGSGTSTVTLLGSIANINAYIAAGNILFDPPGTSLADRTLHVTISDLGNNGSGGAQTASTDITLHSVSYTFTGGADNIDLHNVVLSNGLSLNLGNGNDTLTTSWNHIGWATTYDGGFGNNNNDAVTLVFTPEQLQEILSSTALRGELTGYLDGAPGSGTTSNTTLDLSSSAWNAIVKGFEHASIALAAGGDVVNTAFTDTLSSSQIKLGTSGANSLTVNSDNNILVGLGGGDTLTAGSGNDVLLGGDGNDILIARNGNTVMWGGSGNDTFNFTASFATGTHHDTILDFTSGDDRIEFNSGVFSDLADLLTHMTQVGNDVVITVGQSDITLKNVSLATLHASDFIVH
jgi:VCBS repeat-containing protein